MSTGPRLTTVAMAILAALLFAAGGCKNDEKKLDAKPLPTPLAAKDVRPEVQAASDVRPETVPEIAPAVEVRAEVKPEVKPVRTAPPPIKPIQYPDGEYRFWYFVERFGVPMGLRKVEPADKVVRPHVKIIVHGGKVVRLHELDGRGRITESRDYEYDGGELPARFRVSNKMGAETSVGEFDEQLTRLTWKQTTGASHLRGCHALQRELDKSGCVVSETCLDSGGQPRPDSGGVVVTAYKRDLLGRETSRNFFDGNGRPVLDYRSIHGEKYQLNLDGLVKSITYLDARQNPTINRIRNAARIEYTIDRKGLLEKEQFLGKAGKAVFNPDGVAAVEYEYSPDGSRIEQRYLGPNGEVKAGTVNRAAIVRMQHDDNGFLAVRMFFDAEGRAAAATKRIHIERLENNSWGDIVSQSFAGADYSDVADANGVSRYLYEYTPEGKLSAVSCWASSGKAVASRGDAAYHRKTVAYDERGRLVRELYYDRKGALTSLWGGATGQEYRYDDLGRVVTALYVGNNAEPVDTRLGFASEKREHDESGRVTRACLFDSLGQPAVAAAKNASGFHCRSWNYGRFSTPDRVLFSDLEGLPVKARLKVRGRKFEAFALDFTLGPGNRVVQEKSFEEDAALPSRVLVCAKGECIDPFKLFPGRIVP